jgi:hypothetical protein
MATGQPHDCLTSSCDFSISLIVATALSGTLTQNSMMFKKCAIGGRQSGRASTQAGVIRRAEMEGRDVGAALSTFEAEPSAPGATARQGGAG